MLLSRKRKYDEEDSNILKDASDSYFSLIFRPFFYAVVDVTLRVKAIISCLKVDDGE